MHKMMMTMILMFCWWWWNRVCSSFWAHFHSSNDKINTYSRHQNFRDKIGYSLFIFSFQMSLKILNSWMCTPKVGISIFYQLSLAKNASKFKKWSRDWFFLSEIPRQANVFSLNFKSREQKGFSASIFLN